MSGAQKRSIAAAEDAANWFFAEMGGWNNVTSYLRCGSIRRKLPKVGDIECVAVAKHDEHGNNMLWASLDLMVKGGLIKVNDQGEPIVPAAPPAKVDFMGAAPDAPIEWRKARWGEVYREFWYRDWKFDLFTATADNFWLQTVIRTGNWIFSRNLMQAIKHRGVYRIGEGYIRPAFEKRGDFKDDPKRGLTVKGINELAIIPALSEDHVLKLAGPQFVIAPEQREWVDE